jgi:hypothetical protein
LKKLITPVMIHLYKYKLKKIMKQSKVRKYIHQQNLNTLKNLPSSAKALVDIYESMTRTTKREAIAEELNEAVNNT